MRKSFVITILVLHGFCSYSQVSDSKDSVGGGASMQAGNLGMAVRKLKSNNAVLPRWMFDLNYRFGAISQEIEMIDLASSYTGSLSTSHFEQPVFSSGQTSGGEAHLGYFFNKERTIGISIGGMYLRHTGTMTMDSFYADYRETILDTVYRQIIHTNGSLKEDVEITNINIPVLLQFKHQFGTPSNPSNFGITGAIGGLFGVSNETRTRQASGNFSYEAIYRLSPDKSSFISGFDDGIPPSHSTSLIITEKDYNKNEDAANVNKSFDALRSSSEIFNVGLYKNIAEGQRTGTASYNKLGIGGMVQIGLTYSLAYNVAFQLSGFYMYQTWSAIDNEGYRPTDKVIIENSNSYGNYRVMTGGIKKSDYSAYGMTAGFRIFFGEKRDVDGDKVHDGIDKCKFEFGEARFYGCPDTDGDGIVDNQDACKFEAGPEYTNGCPDRDADGVADKVDICPDEYGDLRNGCPVMARQDSQADTTLIDEKGVLMGPHIVLETDVLYFDHGKTEIKDSASAILIYAAKLLERNPKVVIHISGYTDDIGSFRNNLVLSYERSKAARKFLQDSGISDERIIISGYGMDNPATPNDTPENRAKNRRIEMKLLLPL